MSAWNTPPRPQDIPHRSTLDKMIETAELMRRMVIDLEVWSGDIRSGRADDRIDDTRTAVIELRDELVRLHNRRAAG